MSRYELPPLETRPKVKSVVVGWDRPLSTYFLQVRNRHGGMIEWRGTTVGSIPTPTEIVLLAERYATVPPELEAALDADRRASATEPDGPALAALKAAGIVG